MFLIVVFTGLSVGHTPHRSRNASRESDRNRNLDELDRDNKEDVARDEEPQHVVRITLV